MAATALTVHAFSENTALNPPVAEVAADATNGNTYTNGSTTWLEATNGGAGSATITVPYVNTVDGQTVPSRVYTVPAAGKLKAGPFPVSLFGANPTVTASAATVTLAVYTIVPAN